MKQVPVILFTHRDFTSRLREGYVSIFAGETKAFSTILTQEFSVALYSTDP